MSTDKSLCPGLSFWCWVGYKILHLSRNAKSVWNALRNFASDADASRRRTNGALQPSNTNMAILIGKHTAYPDDIITVSVNILAKCSQYEKMPKYFRNLHCLQNKTKWFLFGLGPDSKSLVFSLSKALVGFLFRTKLRVRMLTKVSPWKPGFGASPKRTWDARSRGWLKRFTTKYRTHLSWSLHGKIFIFPNNCYLIFCSICNFVQNDC